MRTAALAATVAAAGLAAGLPSTRAVVSPLCTVRELKQQLVEVVAGKDRANCATAVPCGWCRACAAGESGAVDGGGDAEATSAAGAIAPNGGRGRRVDLRAVFLWHVGGRTGEASEMATPSITLSRWAIAHGDKLVVSFAWRGGGGGGD